MSRSRNDGRKCTEEIRLCHTDRPSQRRKSTLMNHLIGQKIAITSDKPQTTRNRIQTVYTDERGQIIFLDTPGIHKAKTSWANIW